MTWFSKANRVRQLARFLEEFSRNYNTLKYYSRNRPGEQIFRLMEAYNRTRRPVMTKLAGPGPVEITSKMKSLYGSTPKGRTLASQFYDVAENIKKKKIAPVTYIQVSPEKQVQAADPFDNIETLAHEHMHSAQHWRKSRPYELSQIPYMPWYLEAFRDNSDLWDAYINSPYEVQARRAGEVAKKDFSKFINAVTDIVGNPTAPLETKKAANSLLDTLFAPVRVRESDAKVKRLLEGFTDLGRPWRYR
jgi:hypothetical protein